MDDWDLFAQIRPATPPPPPKKTLEEAKGAADAASTSSAADDDSSELAAEKNVVGDIAVGGGIIQTGTKAEGDEMDEPSSAQVSKEPTPPGFYRRRRPRTVKINGRVQSIVDDRPSTKSLDHLPPEILEQIYRRLDGASMSNLALCCKRLYDVSFNECIWTERIEREFAIKPDCYRFRV